MKLKCLRQVCLLSVAVIAVPSVCPAQDRETTGKARIHHELVTELERNPVEYRALNKRAMEGHLGALGLLLTRRAPDSDLIPFHAEALVVLTNRHASFYPEGSETAHTSESIWNDRAAFQKQSQRTAELAQQLKEIVDRGDAMQSMNALVRFGESCESCHALYRLGADE